MAKSLPQYYFTVEDPDYSPKGSRDPLGFQVIWQHQGSKLIKHLSTVSVNLHDFQILCLAHYFYGKEPDNGFVKFFLRFEQLMAYTRYVPKANNGFNGITEVARNLQNAKTIIISAKSDYQILSNQRAYGIWGKYSRPFREIGFVNRSNFIAIFENKINELVEKTEILRVIEKVKENEQWSCHVEALEILKPLLQLNDEELNFYTNAILKVEGPVTHQNDLYNYISNHFDQIPEGFNLYPFLHQFATSLELNKVELKSILMDIEHAEKVICPLNYIFRYIQTKPNWTKEEIRTDSYIEQCKEKVDYAFKEQILNELKSSLNKDNWNLVVDLIEVNKKTTDRRGGSAWISIHNDVLNVNHSEGGFKDPDFNPKLNFQNGYFINTYIELFRQIKSKI